MQYKNINYLIFWKSIRTQGTTKGNKSTFSSSCFNAKPVKGSNQNNIALKNRKKNWKNKKKIIQFGPAEQI